MSRSDREFGECVGWPVEMSHQTAAWLGRRSGSIMMVSFV